MTDPDTSARTGLRTVDPRHVAGLADLLGAEDVDTAPGAPLPALWHWAALAQWAPAGSLGPDGHPVDDGLPRRLDLPRRMFAGGEVTVRRPLRVGAQVEVRRTVDEVRDTQGRSGPLRFVTVRDTFHDETGPALEERLDLVYRAAAVPRAGAAPEAGPDEGDPGLTRHGEAWRLLADAPTLMRFSALTCNSHRIHYDRPWATLTEGYDDLVVHGPLLAIALAEVARRAGGPLRSVVHRGTAPLLRGEVADLTLTTAPDGGPADDTVVRAHRPTDGEPRLLSSVTVHHQHEETP